MHFDRLKRREFILCSASSAAWSAAVGAQQGERMRRGGVAMGLTERDSHASRALGLMAKLP